MTSATSEISVFGARTHNLANISVSFPRDALVVVTGPSGSGKSSLAFDTIYAEALRKFLESLSLDARASLERLPRPPVDRIDGLSPAIAVEQRAADQRSQSTLGTLTEITDLLRLLFARFGTPHCPTCGDPLIARSKTSIIDDIYGLPAGTKVNILAPQPSGSRAEVEANIQELQRQGYVRAMLDGQLVDLGQVDLGAKAFARTLHRLDVVVDRIVCKEGIRGRIGDSVELALTLGRDRVVTLADLPTTTSPVRRFFSTVPSCEKDQVSLPAPEPSLFSRASIHGRCPQCEGHGTFRSLAMERILPDPNKSLREGAVTAFGPKGSLSQALFVKAVVAALGVDPDVPVASFDPNVVAVILEGGTLPQLRSDMLPTKGKKKGTYPGVRSILSGKIDGDEPESEDEALDPTTLRDVFSVERSCDLCRGTGLSAAARAVKLQGMDIATLERKNLTDVATYIDTLVVASTATSAVGLLTEPIRARISTLLEFELDGLCLHRPLAQMSTGELQRARLSPLLSGGLAGVLYVLDEPTAGLSPRHVGALIAALRRLVALGNSVLVVEHDLAMIRAADYVLELGPGAGQLGGRVTFAGTPGEMALDATSVTGPFLRESAEIAPGRSGPMSKLDRVLGLRDVQLTNGTFRSLDLPLGRLVGVSGESGVGKSLFWMRAVPALFRGDLAQAGTVLGEAPDRVIAADASPIGRTLRSNPASFLGCFTHIREMFATLPESKVRGWTAARFSLNVKGGRCETCVGLGSVKLAFGFVSDVRVPCTDCDATGYSRETREVRSKGRSIADVLALSVDEAIGHFAAIVSIERPLTMLSRLGLGYLLLGQPAPTLSGGEAQRLRLARELARPLARRAELSSSLYLLDEPTRGLHRVDVAKLMQALFLLRDQGATIVVIEHDLDVLAGTDVQIQMV